MDQSAINGVVLYAPAEVEKWDDLELDDGWWVSAGLKRNQPGDRLAVYRTTSDPGIVGLFDVASEAFDTESDLGWAVYGRPTPLPSTIHRPALLEVEPLRDVFLRLQRRRYLPPTAARHLAEWVLPLPVAGSDDPLPEPNDPNWDWTPTERRWGRETAASDSIATHPRAWRALGYLQRPERELSPATGSKRRTDLMGRGRGQVGIIAEVKHFVDSATLAQLDEYLTEARVDGRRWNGHLVSLSAYTADVRRATKNRDDVRLWKCERDPSGLPSLQVIE